MNGIECLQTTAGATFFLGISHTLMFRKDYVEYIFKLDNGYYGVVNFVLQRVDQALLLTDWGDFFRRISNHEDPDKLMRMLQKPCPTVVDVMTGKSGYSLVRDRNNQMRVGCPLPVSADTSLLSVVADTRIIDKATDLLDYSLRLYHEIYDHCPSQVGRKGCRRCSERGVEPRCPRGNLEEVQLCLTAACSLAGTSGT